MSSRARRLPSDAAITPFPWTPKGPERITAASRRDEPVIDETALRARAEAVEREAFAKGYAQGERAGQAAANERAEVLMAELARTMAAIAAERAGMLRKTERDVVRLSLAMAARILHREVSQDPELMLAMARVAIDRMGDHVAATVRLHPEDHQALVAALAAQSARGASDPPVFAIEADPHVPRGGCLVTSDYGVVDLGIDAQIAELARAILPADVSGR